MEAETQGITNTVRRIEHGAPIEEILDYVDLNDIDAVVMGTTGRRGTDRILLGSVAEKTVRSAPVLSSRLEVRSNILIGTPELSDIDHFEDLQQSDETFADIAAPPMTLAAETNVSDAFDQFPAEDQEIALILQAGEVVGLLTAADALEAVMSELEDPLDK